MKLINSCLASPKWNFSNFMNVSTEIFNPLIEKKIKSIVRCKRAKSAQSYLIRGQEISGIYFARKEKHQTIEKC